MPTSGDTKKVTSIMYENEIIQMRDQAYDAWQSGGSYTGLIGLCQTFMATATSPIAIATKAILEYVDFMSELTENYYQDLFDAYQDAQDLMQGAGPILYYDVKQEYVYVTKGSTGAWITKKLPTFVGHFDDH